MKRMTGKRGKKGKEEKRKRLTEKIKLVTL